MAAQPARIALLSIHPRYAEAIMSGSKLVELRKTGLRPNTSHVAVYATSPVQHVIGVFRVGLVDAAAPAELWERYEQVAGVTREEFFSYYGGRQTGYAINILDVVDLPFPLRLDEFSPRLTPPQSIVYLRDDQAQRLAAYLEPTGAVPAEEGSLVPEALRRLMVLGLRPLSVVWKATSRLVTSKL